jgi:hypothetical protein
VCTDTYIEPDSNPPLVVCADCLPAKKERERGRERERERERERGTERHVCERERDRV